MSECLKRQDELIQNSLKTSDRILVGWDSLFNKKRGKAARRIHVHTCVF